MFPTLHLFKVWGRTHVRAHTASSDWATRWYGRLRVNAVEGSDIMSEPSKKLCQCRCQIVRSSQRAGHVGSVTHPMFE
jgi:hypothetical protein